ESDFTASVKAAPVGGASTIETPSTVTKATKNQVKPIAVDFQNLNQSFKNLETKLLKNIKPPDPCSVTVSTLNLTETCLCAGPNYKSLTIKRF
ncbi:hypothetical protein DOY81_014947, partial [Sarcophaga bullata]